MICLLMNIMLALYKSHLTQKVVTVKYGCITTRDIPATTTLAPVKEVLDKFPCLTDYEMLVVI